MSPFSILFLALIAVPLIELYFLISVGKVIGAGLTVAVVILTAVIGAWLLRLQGLATLNRIQRTTAAGKLPAQELIEGLILLITGALLLTPGFFTDAIGFALLVPPIRGWCARKLLASGVYQARVHAGERYDNANRNARSTHIFEGEYYETNADRHNADEKRLEKDEQQDP
ncbi:MAG: FxsA family protein [Gammaproteobacteria bacterium]